MKHYDITLFSSEDTYKGKGYGSSHFPTRNARHVDKILAEYEEVIREDEEELSHVDVPIKRDGYYLRFNNQSGKDLSIDKIDSSSIGHIVSVTEDQNDRGKITSVVLYLNKNKRNWLNKKATAYKTQRTKNNERCNKPLIDSIESVQSVSVNDLWHGKGELPGEGREWVELWFKETMSETVLHLLDQLGIEHKPQYLFFPERVVVLANVNSGDISRLYFASSSLVRLSAVPTLAGFITDESSYEQADWLNMIMGQFNYNGVGDRYLCILDSGIKTGHPMLSPFISNNDCFAVNPQWGLNDVRHHGTQMAGLAIYGDLTDVLAQHQQIEPTYRLCSVKVLPNTGSTLKEFWGDYTKQAVSKAEIGNVHVPDIMAYCMAIAETKGHSDGKPSSWSSAIDQICYGEDGRSRLFIQCAGNVDEDSDFIRYPISNRTLSVLNPGQAWNALTVGAYTEKFHAIDETGIQKNVIAPADALSPYSTTSESWQTTMPIKPEILMEGGNRIKDGNSTERHRDLELLTTGAMFGFGRHFDLFNATSAATALAARYAAIVSMDNPDYWPETIRGLFVHTADWTDQMNHDHHDIEERLRMCGYGVPNLEKMQNSRKNGVTFVAQKTIKPYKLNGNQASFNKLHIFELPWPRETLLDMGEKNVRLTITLSYFIEPGPTDNFSSSYKKYSYASSGLRFDLCNPNENADQLKARIRRESDETVGSVNNDTGRWAIGIQKRTRGSIHKDWVETTAADLATCNLIAVYPVSGWWYKRKSTHKVETEMRYSLIVSLETSENADFSVEINNEIAIKNAIPVEIDV